MMRIGAPMTSENSLSSSALEEAAMGAADGVAGDVSDDDLGANDTCANLSRAAE